MYTVVSAGSFLATIGYESVIEIHKFDYICTFNERGEPKVFIRGQVILDHEDPAMVYRIAVRLSQELGIPYLTKD